MTMTEATRVKQEEPADDTVDAVEPAEAVPDEQSEQRD